MRNESGQLIQSTDIRINAEGLRESITRDANGTVVQHKREQRLNVDTVRTTLLAADGTLLETLVVQNVRTPDGQLYTLSDRSNHQTQERTLDTLGPNGEVRQSTGIAMDAAPVQMTEAFRNQLHSDVADFLSALRRKDRPGILLAGARLAIDYAHTQGAITLPYDQALQDVSNGLGLINALRSLQSSDTLAQIGGGIGLLNSSNYLAQRLTGSGYLSPTQTATLAQLGAVLSIANLVHLDQMLKAGQLGSATASIISAVNSIAYLSKASSALMGQGAMIAWNPIAMVVMAFVFDSLFANDPPPPPPQGLLQFIRGSEGQLSYRISASNPLGQSILQNAMQQLLPKLESQLVSANQNIADPEQRLVLIASRMPSIQLSSWPSAEHNGEENYFFVLEQSNPLRDEPALLALARQDLTRLYADSLFTPEAIMQQWERNHLQTKFGADEANWISEAAWLRDHSTIEQTRSQLNAELKQAHTDWELSAQAHLALGDWSNEGGVQGNVSNSSASPSQPSVVAEAFERLRAVQQRVRAYEQAHPLLATDAVRAKPQQEAEFARSRGVRSTVALQWAQVIAIDLGGDGLQRLDLPGNLGSELTSLRRQARFDIDGDGYREAMQWLAPSEALLAIDRDGDGLISQGNELFNRADTPPDQHGLASLAWFDANGDGQLNALDPVWKRLKLWIDLDSDGSSGALELFQLALPETSEPSHSRPSPLAAISIDLANASLKFADGSQGSLSNLPLLAQLQGLQIIQDSRSGNLNVLHEDGHRENFITLVEDMSALAELVNPNLNPSRRATLVALAASYGLNPQSLDFQAIVQGVRSSGQALEQQNTVIYFGDDNVWADPALRSRFESMRMSFQKLALGTAADPQLASMGQPLAPLSLLAQSGFDDRWVASRKLNASDILSETPVPTPPPEPTAAVLLLPENVISLVQATKGAQEGGLVRQIAAVVSVAASLPSTPPSTPPASPNDSSTSPPETQVQVLNVDKPVAIIDACQWEINEECPLAVSFAQIEREAALMHAQQGEYLRFEFLGLRHVQQGQVNIDEAQGQLIFQPRQDFYGNAGFSFVLADQFGRIWQRDARIAVRPINDAPRVSGELIHAKEDIPLLIDTSALLANDYDIEDDALSISGLARVAFGRAELQENGQIYYTPPSDQYGITDTIEYIVRDSQGASAVGQINITLAAVEDAPTVVSERILHAKEDQTLRIPSRLLLWNDLDLDTHAIHGAQALKLTAVGSASHGTISLSGANEVLFSPDPDFNGSASFSYTVMDSSGLSTTGRALIEFEAVSDLPQVAGEQIAGREDTPLVMDTRLLLANDRDPDILRGEAQQLSIVAVDLAVGGWVQLSDGHISFTPDADRQGSASFRYTVSDGAGGLAQAKVSIQLEAVDDAPQYLGQQPAELISLEDQEVRISESALARLFRDAEGDALSIAPHTLQALSLGDTLGFDESRRELVYKPAANSHGLHQIRLAMSDGQRLSAEQTLTLSIQAVNDAPIVKAVGFQMLEDGGEVEAGRSAWSYIDYQLLLSGAADIEGDTLSISSVGHGSISPSASSGMVQLVNDSEQQRVAIKAPLNYHGTLQFEFTVSDSQGAGTTQIAYGRVLAVNDVPVLTAQKISATATYQSVLTTQRINSTNERWQLSSWDPDSNESMRFAIERNPLRGSVQLGAVATTHLADGSTRATTTLSIASGTGGTTSKETVWVGAYDTAGQHAQLNLSFIGRYNVDPIVIDCDGDGLEFIPLQDSHVQFGVGEEARRMAWVGPEDGLLAWDRNHNGVIDQLDEIAFAEDGEADSFGRSDLQILQQARVDQNQDGLLSSSDPVWQAFYLWRDADSNGISTPNELRSLDQAGVLKLHLSANVLNRAEGPDVRVRGYTRVEMQDGRQLQAADVWLRRQGPDDIKPVEEDARLATQLGTEPLADLLRQLALTPTGSNHAPLLYGFVPSQQAQEAMPFRLEFAPNLFIDPDVGDRLQFELGLANGQPLPSWLKFNASQLLLLGTPGREEIGSLELQLTATDRQGAFNRVNFSLTTEAINHALGLAQTLPTLQWLPDEDNSYHLATGLFIDSDPDDALQLEIRLADGSALPTWLQFDAALATLHGSPSLDSLQRGLTLRVSATDSWGLSASGLMMISAPTLGSASDDTLFGTQSDDALMGLSGSDSLFGQGGDDVLIGGAGNDHLFGGEGHDRYRFNAAWGDDELFETGDPNEHNSIEFGAGISPSDLLFKRDLNTLQIWHRQGESHLYVDFETGSGSGQTPLDLIQSFHFANGETWNALSADAVAFEGGLSWRDDVFSGSALADTIYSGGGNDEVHGGAGNDVLFGGLGDDALFGDTGNDLLNGGAGDDFLAGGAGDDTYQWCAGEGQDSVLDTSGFDTVELIDITNFSALSFKRQGESLLAQFNGSHDSLTIQSFFLADGGLNKNGGIDSFTLASGERIAASTLATLLPVTDTTTRPFAA